MAMPRLLLHPVMVLLPVLVLGLLLLRVRFKPVLLGLGMQVLYLCLFVGWPNYGIGPPAWI